LSIVERIAKVLGHTVGLRSTPDRGSIFSVEVPCVLAGAAAQTESAAAAPPGSIAGLKVLCIDNEPTVLSGMRSLLEGWGCAVTTVQSAAQALDALLPGESAPDIVLADYHLDEGTGIEAVAAIRAKTQAPISAVIITADYSAAVQREVRMQGHSLLRKPLKVAALRALIYQLTLQRAVAAE
jgi:CheY-like chemotaxis protein